MTLAAIARQTSDHGQRLPVDPSQPELTTVGSLIAGAKAGPLRLSEGTVRDLLIGIRFVGHGGRIIHAGGRVVKNVAGYDLMKVMTGSFGTLGIITEAALKVRPIPSIYELAIARFFVNHGSLRSSVAMRSSRAARALRDCQRGFGRFIRTSRASLSCWPDIRGFATKSSICAPVCAPFSEPLSQILEGSQAGDAYQRLRDLDLDNAALAGQIAVLPRELARCVEASGAEFRAHALSGVAQSVSTAL